MPTTEFDFREFARLVGRDLSPDDARESISMLGVDVERMDEEKIVMEVFPNRPDMLGIEGFARAYRGIAGIETGLKRYGIEASSVRLTVDPRVRGIRPYIAAGIIRDASLTEEALVSLMNLQEKLHITHGRNRKKVAIGVHDMSRVKDPFLYTAIKPGEVSFVPLDMKEEMNLWEVLKEHPKGKAHAWILEGMSAFPVILDRDRNVLSFPPIINGELTRVSRGTKDVLVEVTGLEEKAVNQALNILVSSMLDRGGKAYTVDIV